MNHQANEAGRQDEMVRFLDVLQDAIRRLRDPYFALPIDGQPVPIYRERVYAYELYHQLRCVWPEKSSFVVSGEVDKSGHPFFREGLLENAKPDLLVHSPGRMSGNLIVIEIKRVAASAEELAADLRKIGSFCRGAQYHLGVLILFGVGEQAEIEDKCCQALVLGGQHCDLPATRVFWQGASGETPVEIALDRKCTVRNASLIPLSD
jgi:hypothetical protein